MSTWTELSPPERPVLREMFSTCPGMHGGVAAVLDGGMGSAMADDAQNPSTGFLHAGDFRLFAGEPVRDLVEGLLEKIVVVPDPQWDELIRQIAGADVETFQRVAFDAGHWDIEELRDLSGRLPDGFFLRRVEAADMPGFAELDQSLVDNFADYSAFQNEGVGFAIVHKEKIVAGCSSYLIGGGKLEIEIHTHSDYRRRGLAAGAAAALISYCLEHDIEPCWDAANEESAALAEKLGFLNPRPYTAYWLPS